MAAVPASPSKQVAGERPRLLVLSHYFWPEAFRINQVVDDLVAAGADVTILTGQPNYGQGTAFPGYDASKAGRERHPTGYEIIRVPVVTRGRGGSVRLALNYLSFTFNAALFGSWMLRGRRFDTVFVYCTTPVIQGFAALWLGRIKGAKVVLWIQDLWPQALAATGHVRNRTALALVRRLVAALYRRSDLLLAQSQAYLPVLRADAGGTPVIYFPNPGDPGASGEGGAAVALPEGKFNLVFAGNLGKAQALETLVDAADRLRDHPHIHFTLFGSGSAGQDIAARILAGGLENVTLGGRLPPEAMAGVYRQASALVLTLVDDPLLAQTVPSKLQSYFAAGRPIVSAVTGEASRLVVEAGAGVACPAEQPAALAEAVLDLSRRPPSELDAMGAAGRRYFADRFEPKRLARDLLALLGGDRMPAANPEPAGAPDCPPFEDGLGKRG